MAYSKLHRIQQEIVSKFDRVSGRGQVCRRPARGLAVWPILAVLTTSAAAATGAWTPHASFQLEDSNLKETMIWVSGVSYALTAYYRQAKQQGRPTVYCRPGGEIQSPELFEILNNRYAGKRITSEQAIAAIMQGLRERHPCDVRKEGSISAKEPEDSKGQRTGPSRRVRYLMDEPITLFDWGLHGLADAMGQLRLSGGGPKLTVMSDYNWDKNRIDLTAIAFRRASTRAEAKDWCREAVTGMRAQLGVNPQIGKPARGDSSLLGQYFSHQGFRREGKPKGLNAELDDMTRLSARFSYGPTERKKGAVLCHGRLLSAKTSFGERH